MTLHGAPVKPEVRSYLLSHPELRKNKEYAKLYGRIEKKE